MINTRVPSRQVSNDLQILLGYMQGHIEQIHVDECRELRDCYTLGIPIPFICVNIVLDKSSTKLYLFITLKLTLYISDFSFSFLK